MNSPQRFIDLLILCSVIWSLRLFEPTFTWANSETQPKADLRITQATQLFSQGKWEESIAILRAISNGRHITHKDQELEFDALLLLSAFAPGTTAFAERAQFAELLLQHPLAHEKLQQSDRKRLYRTAGLGWFSQGQWDKAAQNFQSLIENGSISDITLAQIHLGWIEINQKNAQRAFRRWLDFLTQSPSQVDPQWLPILLKDLGQLWVLAGDASLEVTHAMNQLIALEGHREKLIEGILSGISEADIHQQHWRDFRKVALQTQIKDLILDQIINSQTISESAPCETLKWFEEKPFRRPDLYRSSLQHLQGCLKLLQTLDSDTRQELESALLQIRDQADPAFRTILQHPKFGLIQLYLLQKEPQPSRRLELIQEFYPDPTTLRRQKNASITLILLEALQKLTESELNQDQILTRIIDWIEHLEEYRFLPLSQDNLWITAFQLGRTSGAWQQLWNQVNSAHPNLFKSQRVVNALNGWMIPILEKALQTGALPPEPGHPSVTRSAFELTQHLLMLKKQITPTPESDQISFLLKLTPVHTMKHLHLGQKKTAGTSVESLNRGIHDLVAARRITISLEDRNFFKPLQNKLILIKKGATNLRQAYSTLSLGQYIVRDLLNLALTELQTDLEAIAAPSQWPDDDQNSWNAQRQTLIDGLNAWRVTE